MESMRHRAECAADFCCLAGHGSAKQWKKYIEAKLLGNAWLNITSCDTKVEPKYDLANLLPDDMERNMALERNGGFCKGGFCRCSSLYYQ